MKQLDKEKIINNVIKRIFKDDARFSEYWNIVYNLILKQKCIAPKTALSMKFGEDILPYIDCKVFNEDLITLFFDKDRLLQSELFKQKVNELITIVTLQIDTKNEEIKQL
jgi:hypothetical protein